MGWHISLRKERFPHEKKQQKGEKKTISHFGLRVHMHISFLLFHTIFSRFGGCMETHGNDWMDGIYIHMSLHERGAQPFLQKSFVLSRAFHGMDKDGLEF